MIDLYENAAEKKLKRILNVNKRQRYFYFDTHFCRVDFKVDFYSLAEFTSLYLH